MGQRRITIEVTEMEARVIRWALTRATLVSSNNTRGKLFIQKLHAALSAVETATEGLPDLPPPTINRAPLKFPRTSRRGGRRYR